MTGKDDEDEAYLGPSTVDIGVVQEKERLVGRGGRSHVAKNNAVNYRYHALDHSKARQVKEERQTLRVW